MDKITQKTDIVNSSQSGCPLCTSHKTRFYFEDKARKYLECLECNLVFVPEYFWLRQNEEKAVYDLHENDADDAGYRTFLSRLSDPLLERLPPRQTGLDFGCGPGPTLFKMIEEYGHSVDLYDPFYANNPAVFEKRYDFICATEVVEHFRQPGKELTRLFNMLKPGGLLGIMTKLVIDKEAFSRWHYIRDMTHICFFSRRTFEYIAQRFNADLTFIKNDVILLKREQKE